MARRTPPAPHTKGLKTKALDEEAARTEFNGALASWISDHVISSPIKTKDGQNDLTLDINTRIQDAANALLELRLKGARIDVAGNHEVDAAVTKLSGAIGDIPKLYEEPSDAPTIDVAAQLKLIRGMITDVVKSNSRSPSALE
jgi:hypothetical protein